MAETQHSAGMARETQADRELTINLRPYGWLRWEFYGTRAQLEAEGVIPAGTEWPATGSREAKWTAGPLSFSLRRTRPAGTKGPMRLWVNGDWWWLCFEQINPPCTLQQRLIDAQRAIERAAYERSPAGRREWKARFQRYWTAHEDKHFQSFKASIPALMPTKRGRRAADGSRIGGML